MSMKGCGLQSCYFLSASHYCFCSNYLLPERADDYIHTFGRQTSITYWIIKMILRFYNSYATVFLSCVNFYYFSLVFCHWQCPAYLTTGLPSVSSLLGRCFVHSLNSNTSKTCLMWNNFNYDDICTHLEKAHCAKWCLNWLHLWVLGKQHMLDTRFTVVEWTVPRYMVATTKCVFCRRVNKRTHSFSNY